MAGSLAEQRVRSDDLASKHKGRRDKQERLASVLAGGFHAAQRFGAAAGSLDTVRACEPALHRLCI